MIELADATAGNDRDIDRFGHRARKREIEAFAGTVAVHAREQDLARAQLLHFTRPFDRVQSGRPTSPMSKHLPANPGPAAARVLFWRRSRHDATERRSDPRRRR